MEIKFWTSHAIDSTSEPNSLVDFHTGVYASAVPARAASSAISSLEAIAVDSSPVVACVEIKFRTPHDGVEVT